ncbi:MAG TPA: hypothetical protein VG963_10375, partial [Polyangiaceae bacterium]|nr:hypothetical protein [Polyangiaceae bacterium]
SQAGFRFGSSARTSRSTSQHGTATLIATRPLYASRARRLSFCFLQASSRDIPRDVLVSDHRSRGRGDGAGDGSADPSHLVNGVFH